MLNSGEPDRQVDDPIIIPVAQEEAVMSSGQKLDALLHTPAVNDSLTDEQLTYLAKQWADDVYNSIDAGNITLNEALEFLQSRSPEFGVIYEDNFYGKDRESIEDQSEVLARAIERAVVEKVLTMQETRNIVPNGKKETTNQHFKLLEVTELLNYATLPNSINRDLLEGGIKIEDVLASLNGYLTVEDVWVDGEIRHSAEGYNDLCGAIKEGMLIGKIPIDYMQAQSTLRDIDIWTETAEGYEYPLGRIKFGVIKEIARALDDDGPNVSLSVDDEVRVNRYDIVGEVLDPEIKYLIVGFRDEAYRCIQISDGKRDIWVSPRVIKEIVIDDE